MKSILVFTQAFIVVSLLICCTHNTQEKSHSKYPYGVDFNITRKKLQIPVIEKDWIQHDSNDSIFFWCNPQKQILKSRPHHFYKSVELKRNQIYLEIDAYNYEIRKDSIDAYRLIMSTFLSPKMEIDSQVFELIVYLNEVYPPTTSMYYSKSETDSLLKTWKMDFSLLGE